MDDERVQLHETLRAIIGASRELPPDHDEALADLLADEIAELARPAATAARPARPPLWMSLGLAFITSGALSALAPTDGNWGAFLLVWAFMLPVMTAVVEAGHLLAVNRAARRLHG
ncbi:MAG TPA: hypothetical protein VFB58_11055 [Chloroflexota bacterium]|nr:hypothetical protein [Chloroflexota bacterium]